MDKENKFVSNDDFPRVEISAEHVSMLEIKKSPLMKIDGNYGEILRFEQNGDVFYKGELVENAKDVVEGFRQFLREQGYPL